MEQGSADFLWWMIMTKTSRLNVAPFALPNTPANEIWFEQARDIQELLVRFKAGPDRVPGLSYRRKYWPDRRYELSADRENPGAFGWQPMDDWFKGDWQPARVTVHRSGGLYRFRFLPLSQDGLAGDWAGYDVTFRRTLALRLDDVDALNVEEIQVFTTSALSRTQLHIQLDAGRKTPARHLAFDTYNAVLVSRTPLRRGGFDVVVDHLLPASAYGGDEAHVTLHVGKEAYTIAMTDVLQGEGIWLAEAGIFVATRDAELDFEKYRQKQSRRPVLDQVHERPEQTFACAFFGQPRGHSVNFNIGCLHSPQRFRIEPTGDVLLDNRDINAHYQRPQAEPRYRARGKGQFFFGLERWICDARFMDPVPVPITNLHLHNGDLGCEQRAVCVPVSRSILEGEPGFNEPTAVLIRFRFRNSGSSPIRAVLPLRYSEEAVRYGYDRGHDYRLHRTALTPLTIESGRVTSPFEGRDVLRAIYECDWRVEGQDLVRDLDPGECNDVLIKIPFVDLDCDPEKQALRALDFGVACRDATAFWRERQKNRATLTTPIPQLNAVHDAHAMYVEFSDNVVPENPAWITTSVGTSTYPNFINEACMIIQELDQRGVTEGVRRRLQLYVESQGEAKQPGNFTDFDGALYGARGWECGAYNQHHGWALWYLAEHYLLTRDDVWFATVAPAVLKAADWVFRQRRNTMAALPHSRGWEQGWLPAGSLEDVEDFYYWLSTNVLTWRGTDTAARALERAGHVEAARVRRESDAYRGDLIRGLELNRRHAPVVKLRDGRWVPHYPSRLYCRGRDIGWIREVLEGAVYLLISGLYDCHSKQAGWILNDYQDNLLNAPPYGYVIRDPENNVWWRGGFSMQPNLLANLMPHLDRDEIEAYLWIFFNAFASCYREEVNGMVEHPLPELGFDNSATIKTSDQANSIMWLRYMMVYSTRDYLHFGRAIPRDWLKDGEQVSVTRVRTHYGEVDARWTSRLAAGELVFEGELRGSQDAAVTWVRFRHPDRAAIRGVHVNGQAWTAFDPAKGDVDITGLRGHVSIRARY